MTTLNQPAAAAPAKALLGTKLGMTQIWDEDGVLRPVTVVRVDTNVVTQIRTVLGTVTGIMPVRSANAIAVDPTPNAKALSTPAVGVWLSVKTMIMPGSA